MKKITLLLACLFAFSLSARAQSTVVVGQGIMPSGSTLPTTCAPTKASDPDSLVLFYHTTSSGGAIGLYQCTAPNTWSPAGGGSGTVTSVSGTTNQIDVATGTTTPVISLDPAFQFSSTAAGALTTAPFLFTGNPVTGGSGTTTVPLYYFNGGTAPTTWSTNGTYLGVNAVSGFTGNFLDFHVNGASSVFNISSIGALSSASTLTGSQDCLTTVSACWAGASGGFQAQNGGGSNFVPIIGGPTITAKDTGPFGATLVSGLTACETAFATTSVNTGSATTTTGQTCVPANAMIVDVVYRITTTITTATSFTVGITGSVSKFCSTQSTLTAGTVGHCNLQMNAGAAESGASAVAVVVTFNGTPGAGAIRLEVASIAATTPTS